MKKELQKISDYLIRYYNITDGTPFTVQKAKAHTLFTKNRFDLAAKLYYIKNKIEHNRMELSIYLYESHLNALQDGRMEEPGNKEKTGISSYLKSFDLLIAGFLNGTYDENKAYIPVDKNGVLLDGSHRVACSIYFQREVSVISFSTIEGYCYHSEFFRKHCLERGYLRIMAGVYPQYREDVFLILLWPKALSSPLYKKAGKLLEEQSFSILYKERIETDFEQFVNVIYQCYQKENWLGNKEDNFKGVQNKAGSCYARVQAYEIYMVQGTTATALAQMKEEVRKLLNMGKRGIHTTDTQEECSRITSYVFGLNKIEESQKIVLTAKEKRWYSKIRIIKNLHIRLVLRVKKTLGMIP